MLAQVTISDEQVAVHKATEALAVFVGIPFLTYVAATSDDPLTKWGAAGFALATLVVDGGLLLRWRRS